MSYLNKIITIEILHRACYGIHFIDQSGSGFDFTLENSMYFLFKKDCKFYEIYAAKNLLGDWQITRRYGRTGSRGREKHEIAKDKNDAAKRMFELARHRTQSRGYDLLKSNF